MVASTVYQFGKPRGGGNLQLFGCRISQIQPKSNTGSLEGILADLRGMPQG